MSDEREFVELRPAYDSDWFGSVTAETSMVAASADLYEMAGLDFHRWTIVGIDGFAFSHGGDPRWTVSVLAVDREANGVTEYDDWSRIEADRGSIPVHSIELHDVTLDDVIRSMKVIHLQLLSPNIGALDIVARGDHPPQD